MRLSARPTTADMVRNITHAYSLATRADVLAGLDWYPKAHAIICEWADHHGRSIANVACIVAALSPQCEWTRNLIIAEDILQGLAPSIGGTITAFLRIAERIREDRVGDTATYFKQGCKVRCFAANLAGNYDIVTVDTHGAQVAAGSPASNLRVDTWKRYEPVAEAYTLAAQRISPVTRGRKHIEPAFLQAITWLTWKRLYPHKQNQRRQF